MTSSADDIQKLIADIDNLLASGGNRLSRLLSGQAPEPKEVLQRIREFLVRLQDEALQNQPSGQRLSPLVAKFIDQNNNQPLLPSSQTEQAQSNLRVGQLKTEFAGLLQPLQTELEGLLQERATLVQEIRQLEQKRLQNYSLAQQLTNQEQMISEFLQVLMSRLVPTLTPQLTQTSANLPGSLRESNNANLEPTTSTTQAFLESPDHVQRLTQLARELDQRLLSLDGTVNVVFEALQRNINTYHDSLSQALARMHSKGVQGEQLMASFLNNLTQHLQQQSSSFQPFFPELEPEASPQTSVVNPTHTTAEVQPQTLEFIQPENASSLAINPEAEDANITEDLEAVLFELNADSPQSSTTSSELVGDEVDQLYASLFGNEDFNDPSRAPVAPTNQLQQVSGVVVPSPEFSKPEAGTLDLSNLHPQVTEEASVQPTDSSLEPREVFFFEEDISFSSLPQREVSVTDTLPSQLVVEPTSTDTITTLTELLPDTSDQQQLEIASSEENDVLTTVPTISETAEIALAEPTESIATTPEPAIKNDELESSSDNYIPASPQENLLPSKEIQAPTVPNISLDANLLQQLDRDLANFDRHLNSESQSVNNFDSFQVESKPEQLSEENTSTTTFSNLSAPQVEADLDFSPKTEKKKEAPIPLAEISVRSNSNSPNKSEVALNNLESVWYLGIDLGTTGISASLLNRSTFVVHPIYWSAETQSGTASFQQSFRLPAEVYLPTASIPHGENESTEVQEQIMPAAVAQEKVSDHSATTPTPPKSAPDSKKNLYSAQLKPYLKVAIPYKSEQQKWEPVLQLNEFSAGPLIWVVRSLSKLLLTLKSNRTSTTPSLIAAAVGIDEQTFPKIINNIGGVICTCPSSSSEQYRFNVREALLTSQLIQHPQQVFFVEEAIASLLPELDAANGEKVKLSERQGLRSVKITEHSLVGSTLVINIGATATEMALVDLPENLSQLTHNDFMLHSFAYAGKGIEQDIICQLLLPPKSRQSRTETQGDSKTITSNPWHWQPTIPGLDQMRWHSLGLEELELPRVGEPDIGTRIRLQQRLESSLLGEAVLDAALALKLILQHQDSFTLELADQRWILQRRDLESHVFIPFVRRLNRELNKLLVARGIPTEAINQAILTGGVATIPTVNRWLRQKLPNTKIIQDVYLSENGAPNCSRVAYGLALLPLHPQVLEIPRQQYTDYFLFTELLRLLPDRPLSFNEVIQLFESRGINTRICQQRLLAFLEGELPSGLIPSALDSTWLTQSFHENLDYQAIAAAPLFEKQGSLTYRPNYQQLVFLRHYLDAIKASNQQSLEEPYTVNFALEVHH